MRGLNSSNSAARVRSPAHPPINRRGFQIARFSPYSPRSPHSHTLTVTEMYEPLLEGRSEMHSTCTGPVTCSTALIMDALNSLPPLPIAVKARWIGYLFTLWGGGGERELCLLCSGREAGVGCLLCGLLCGLLCLFTLR